jgi:hypothetical protein
MASPPTVTAEKMTRWPTTLPCAVCATVTVAEPFVVEKVLVRAVGPLWTGVMSSIPPAPSWTPSCSLVPTATTERADRSFQACMARQMPMNCPVVVSSSLPPSFCGFLSTKR